jgi:phosphoribosylaminoimidazolecarboxamide formyltransferase/IMP cyclohydrolase
MKVKTAIISVYDKSGVAELSRGLQDLGVQLLSTGKTAHLLKEQGVTVREIADYTNFPEILGGRVKSLHPKIHAGLLFRRDDQSDRDSIEKLGIEPIDMVVVNLYPLEKVTSHTVDLKEAIENIDIGGPTMIRAAAKNYMSVAVLTDPADYSVVLEELRRAQCNLSEDTCYKLMLKAFERTATYDIAISKYFLQRAVQQGVQTEWPAPQRLLMSFEKIQDLRYGENPHQKAAVYRDALGKWCVASCRMVAGRKELSYTNLLDADAAYALVRDLSDEIAAIIIKHTNPCGIGKAATLAEACKKALQTDPLSAFGGIYAFTKQVDLDTANLLSDKFVELVLAPGYDANALKALSAKKNRRILDLTDILSEDLKTSTTEKTFRRIHGGLLYQDRDDLLLDEKRLKVVTKRSPTEDEKESLRFAWMIVKRVKSNAIVISSKDQLIGVGAGQMSRVESCKIALRKAEENGLDTIGTVMASDAFLPFRDSVDLMGAAGVTAIIQPGGSIRDAEVIEAANEFGIAMICTGIRHFAH